LRLFIKVIHIGLFFNVNNLVFKPADGVLPPCAYSAAKTRGYAVRDRFQPLHHGFAIAVALMMSR
jgi:hypothetical protein